MADGAGLFNEVIGQRFFHLFRPGLFIPPLRHGHKAFKLPLVRLCFSILVGVGKCEHFFPTVLEFLLSFGRKVIKAGIHGEIIGFQKGVQLLVKPAFPVVRKGADSPETEGLLMVRQDSFEIRFQGRTKPHAGRTCTEGIVERKDAGFRFRQRNTAVRAGKMGAEEVILSSRHGSHHEAVSQLQRFFYRVREAAHNAIFNDNAVHHHFNGMLLILLQFDFIGKRKHLPVHPDAHIPFLPEFFQKLLVGSFLLYSHWAQNHELRPVSQSCEGIYNLIYGLPLNGSAAVRAESPAGMGKEHA